MPEVHSPASSRPAAPVSGDAAILARRYADALYELAEESKQLDTVATDLRMLRGFLRDSAEFRALASMPRLTRAQLVGAMKAVASAAKLDQLTANFLALVARNRRLGVAAAIVEAFLAKLAERRGEFSADVRSAQKLTPAQEEKLAAQLRDLAGGKVHLTLSEDPALLGGLTIRLGSQMIDASTRTKLQRLGRELNARQLISSDTPTQKGAA